MHILHTTERLFYEKRQLLRIFWILQPKYKFQNQIGEKEKKKWRGGGGIDHLGFHRKKTFKSNKKYNLKKF